MLRPLAVILLIATALGARPNEPADTLARDFNLSEVVVTGTRTPKALKDSPVSTRLITRAEIQRADADDIAGLLQQEIPGIEISYTMSQHLNMNVAGFAGQNVLVLLDGERLAGETVDNVDFSRLNMNSVARVEIIRGAASALYGSNATGGVVNIISRQAPSGWRASLSSSLGSHGHRRLSALASANYRRFSNTLDISHNRTATYMVCLHPADQCDFRRVPGSHSWNFADRLSYSPLDALKFNARAAYFFKERQYNPDQPDRYRAFTGSLSGDWHISHASNIRLAYNFDQYDKSDFNRLLGLDIRDYSNVQHSLHALFSHTLRSAHILTAGADMMRDWLDTYQFGAGEQHHQYSADLFAQYDMPLSRRLEIIGAARWDYFSIGRRNSITAKLSARLNVGRATLRGGYAGGFRAPSLKEMFMNFNMVDIFDIHGNPDLRPERSHNLNLSAEYSIGNYYLTLGSNLNLVANRIATSPLRYDNLLRPYIQYVNIGRMTVVSIDATARAYWPGGFSGSLSYNFTHEHTPASSFQHYSPARPHSLNCRLSWTHTWREGYDTDITLSGRFLSAVSYNTIYMYEPFEQRRVTNPAYTLWRLQIAQRLLRGIRLTLTLDNLLNYAPAVYTFNAPVTSGTTILAGLTLDLHAF